MSLLHKMEMAQSDGLNGKCPSQTHLCEHWFRTWDGIQGKSWDLWGGRCGFLKWVTGVRPLRVTISIFLPTTSALSDLPQERRWAAAEGSSCHASPLWRVLRCGFPLNNPPLTKLLLLVFLSQCQEKSSTYLTHYTTRIWYLGYYVTNGRVEHSARDAGWREESQVDGTSGSAPHQTIQVRHSCNF